MQKKRVFLQLFLPQNETPTINLIFISPYNSQSRPSQGRLWI